MRAVSTARTPVVSAIGHDVDSPLLDFVADVRASTPTDAAKLIVPDLGEQLALVARLRDTGARALTRRIAHERQRIDLLRSRPVLAHPQTMVASRREEVQRLQERARVRLAHRLERSHDGITHLQGQLRALSPQQTLERGYAVVRQVDGTVVTDVAEVSTDDLLRVTVARGDFAVRPVASS